MIYKYIIYFLHHFHNTKHRAPNKWSNLICMRVNSISTKYPTATEHGHMPMAKVMSSITRRTQWRIYYQECGVYYQLLAAIHWSSPMGGTPHCRQPQPATDNGIRDGRSNWLVELSHPHGQYPLSSTYCIVLTQPTNRKTCCSNRARTRIPGYVRPIHCLCGHSGYK